MQNRAKSRMMYEFWQCCRECTESGEVAEDVRNQAESEECAESGKVADDVRGLARLRRLKGERGARERRRLALLYLAFACDDWLWQGSAYGSLGLRLSLYYGGKWHLRCYFNVIFCLKTA